MSKFTKMWRVTHDEPLTYNERIINSACDIIEKQDDQIKALRKTKCPPISEGDSCICPIEELETLLQQLIFIAEKANTDDSEDTTIELAKQTLKG